MADMVMEAAEYVIMLCSPYPKEAFKVIESRKEAVKKARIKAGHIDPDEEDVADSQLYKKEHRNTTFFDDIEQYAGKDMSAEIADAFGGDEEKPSSTEMYNPDMEDLEFINKAIEMKKQLDGSKKEKQKLDTIEF